MRVREATPADFPDMASEAAAAFWDDSLFEFLHPRRAAYPADFRARFLRGIKTRYYSGNHLLVAETEEGDSLWTGSPVLVGQAIWALEFGKLSGSESSKNESHLDLDLEKKRPSQTSFKALRALERWLLWASDQYVWYFGLDRSLSRRNVMVWRSTKLEDDPFEKSLGDHWHLCSLAVNPKYQRQGIGGLLVDWGVEKAENDGLPAKIVASAAGQGLYRKKGFRDIRALRSPIGISANAMIREPKGMEPGSFKRDGITSGMGVQDQVML